MKSFGFTVGSIQYRPDIAHNAVLESRLGGHPIKPGDKVPKGSSIELVIGKHADRFPIPDMNGMQADEAQAYIRGMNLKIKAVHLITDETGKINTIQRHLPQAGDTVRAGDEVELWIRAPR